MLKSLNLVIVATVLFVAQSATSSAFAAGFCQLSDGTMGMQCVVQTSGQVYGCVKDLKDCGALSPVKPSGATPDAKATAPAEGKITKSRSNIQNN